MNVPTWKHWEHHVQEVLGLSSTPASGAKWQAPGDAVDTGHDSVFPLIVDAKTTKNHSYSITRKFWEQWSQKAAEDGKRFIAALRLWPPGARTPTDVVVIGFDDFAELLAMARAGEDRRQGFARLDEVTARAVDHFLGTRGQ